MKVTFLVDPDQWARLRLHVDTADLPVYIVMQAIQKRLLDDPDLYADILGKARALKAGSDWTELAARAFECDPAVHQEIRMRAIRDRTTIQALYGASVGRMLDDDTFRAMILRRASDLYS